MLSSKCYRIEIYCEIMYNEWSYALYCIMGGFLIWNQKFVRLVF